MTVKNNDGKTALDMAKEKRHKKIYRMIYEKMIDLMSSKNIAKKCSTNKCRKKMKDIISDKVDESFSSNQETAKNCVVCYDQRKGTFALLPCGHAKTCETCCVKIVEETKSCPLCRGNVSKYQKIFD